MKPTISLRLVLLIAFLALLLRYHHDIITGVCYTGAFLEVWDYHTSPLYLPYLRWQWNQLPPLDATPIPEIFAENFTQEAFWEITQNLRRPVVIRGAIANTTSVNEWKKEYFVEHYGDELVLTRHMVDSLDAHARIVQVPMKDFWSAYENGVNVTIFTASGIFSARPELKQQMAAPFEDELRDKDGNGIFFYQMFITPGGRSFYHSEFGGNIFRQVAGRKTWTLIAPEQTKWLCPFLVGEFVALQTCVQSFEPELREKWFKRIPRLQTTLEPGDIIFNPPLYWHDIVTEGAQTQQASVAARMNLKWQSILNGPSQVFLVVRRQQRLQAKLKAKANGRDYFSIDFNQELESFIGETWRNGCLAEGRDDCYGLPQH